MHQRKRSGINDGTTLVPDVTCTAMHVWRVSLTGVAVALLLANLSTDASPPSKRPSVRTNQTNAPAVASGPKSKERVRQVTFGIISREEWLAKEYFGYLCGE